MKHFFLCLWSFLLSVHSSWGLDKDEYFTDLYSHLYNGNYSNLKEKADAAIEAWTRRVRRSEELSSTWRTSFKSSSVSPEDERAAKEGKPYCEKNLAYWNRRRENILDLNSRILFYEQKIKTTLQKCDPLIKTFGDETSWVDITVDKLNLLKAKTELEWEKKIKALKESFFRSIKSERSELLYQDNGYVLGSLYAGIASGWRKAVRVYNWEESLTDVGPKFDEYLKHFDLFMNKYKIDYTHLTFVLDVYLKEGAYTSYPLNEYYRYRSFDLLRKGQEILIEFLTIVQKLEEDK